MGRGGNEDHAENRMNIYPQDLGQGPCARILQWRGMMKGLGPDKLTEDSHLKGGSHYGFIGAMFGFSIGMGQSAFLHFLPFSMDASLVAGGAGALIGYGGVFIAERLSLSKLRVKKINEQEISNVLKGETDSLKKDYLGIVSALISMPSPPTTSEEQSIRNAVRSLGAAIEKLPAQPAEGAFVDPLTLTVEADGLTEKAENEADLVVAASLSRQAKSMRRRAETTTRTAAFARRNLILRQEIAGQINAFQTSIAAASMNGYQEYADFTALAESVAQVAQEANALADARTELDAPLTPLNTVPESAAQIAGR